MFEYGLEGAFTGAVLAGGAEGLGYPCIVGSGEQTSREGALPLLLQWKAVSSLFKQGIFAMLYNSRECCLIQQVPMLPSCTMKRTDAVCSPTSWCSLMLEQK